jgi:hypothetical protein
MILDAFLRKDDFYQVRSRKPEFGGGYKLYLYSNGEEMGGGIFLLDVYLAAGLDPDEAMKEAYREAKAAGEAWLASRKNLFRRVTEVKIE